MLIAEQFIRYAIVGLVSNALLYAFYLLLTAFGVGPKTAMTIGFALGVVQTFFLNRGWTFKSEAGVASSAWKYVTAYAIGYLVNFFGLMVFVDLVGLPHQLVQLVMIFVVAVVIFLLQRHWVFRLQPTRT